MSFPPDYLVYKDGFKHLVFSESYLTRLFKNELLHYILIFIMKKLMFIGMLLLATQSLTCAQAESVPQQPMPELELVDPPATGLTGVLNRSTNSVVLTAILKNNTTYALPYKSDDNKNEIKIALQLYLADPRGCQIAIQATGFVDPAKPRLAKSTLPQFLALKFPWADQSNLTEEDACKVPSKGPWVGQLRLNANGKDIGGSQVTISSRQNPLIEPLIPLAKSQVIWWGFLIPLLFGIVVFFLVLICLKIANLDLPGRAKNSKEKISWKSFVIGEVSWTPSASLVTSITTITTFVNLLNVIPILDDGGRGLSLLSSLEHTFFGVTFAALGVVGLGIAAAFARRAQTLDPNDDNSKRPQAGTYAWVLALRNAFSVSSVVGQLLLVIIIILEAYRNSVLISQATWFLLGLVGIMIVLIGWYGILHAYNQIVEFARGGLVKNGIFLYLSPEDTDKWTVVIKKTVDKDSQGKSLLKPETILSPDYKDGNHNSLPEGTIILSPSKPPKARTSEQSKYRYGL